MAKESKDKPKKNTPASPGMSPAAPTKPTTKKSTKKSTKKPEETKRLRGQPTKYRPEMIGEAKAYIKRCPDVVPSLVGLAMELDVHESTLTKWKLLNPKDLDSNVWPNFDEFLRIVKTVSDFQKRTALNKGADGTWNSRIAKLILGKHGYSDQKETKHGVTEELKTVMDAINGSTKGKLPSEDDRDSAGNLPDTS